MAGPQVDFYVLPERGADPDRLAFKLATKGYDQGMTVFVRAADDAHAAQLDDQFWTFEQLSFLPHCLAADATAGTPVLIGTDEPQPAALLVNLHHATPGDCSNYQRIAEIVAPDPQSRNAGRARYRDYEAGGIKPATHKLKTL